MAPTIINEVNNTIISIFDLRNENYRFLGKRKCLFSSTLLIFYFNLLHYVFFIDSQDRKCIIFLRTHRKS